MNGKLKIREISDSTGLSISTVSRVLAGKSNTSDKAKSLVMNYAKSQGILSDIYGGRLLLNHLTIFAPPRAFDIRTDVFYHKVIQGVVQALEKREVHIRYCGIEENNSDTSLFLERITDPMTEAALIIGIDDPHIHTLAADLKKPCVLINCYDKSMQLDCVAPDHRLIGEFSANYLIRQGHRKILTLICPRRITMERRLSGIKSAYIDNNIEFIEPLHLVTTSGFSTAESELAIGQYFSQTAPEDYPTAILAGGEFMSAGAINALKNMGMSVPADISVMSMDGFSISAIHGIELTSLQVPCSELGEEAINLLQQRILRPESSYRTQLLQGKLAVKESVKPASAYKNNTAIDHRLYD
ncbi:LacI family DNA-binding transcriptional regulator [Budvicia aquatica]|uniref:HTH-type transcriptional repressor CytR n=1 Tax=Budvicia aquatica TaxID=82979 RepID=A0A2C6D069_9GAMM|nr:LacI family DNA-binding transcriptional regulator [Budvicia aquatica]PHI32329.1 LacI family transcriptional regulator [Budvicia aquatica]GKX53863.1 LacI family transcriptional regulator [Budvicia aquatica]VFS45288.1 HTH-type transcriptional repressor CytR [Budvicia aquatica]